MFRAIYQGAIITFVTKMPSILTHQDFLYINQNLFLHCKSIHLFENDSLVQRMNEIEKPKNETKIDFRIKPWLESSR